MKELKARGGKVLAVASEGNEKIKEVADRVFYVLKILNELLPVISVIPLQLFAYYVA